MKSELFPCINSHNQHDNVGALGGPVPDRETAQVIELVSDKSGVDQADLSLSPTLALLCHAGMLTHTTAYWTK